MDVLGPKPRSTRSSMAFSPATTDMPRVWTKRSMGNAQMELDSRIQMLNCVCSILERKSNISAALSAVVARRALINQVTHHSHHGGDAKHEQNHCQAQRHFSPRTESILD